MIASSRRVALVFVLLLRTAYGQTTTASLFGVVRDTTGAVVPQARVVARDRSTSFTRESLTDSSGDYLITNLPVGQYAVTFEKAGFRRERAVERIESDDPADDGPAFVYVLTRTR